MNTGLALVPLATVHRAGLCNRNAAARSNWINWLITRSLPRFVKRSPPYADASALLDRVSELAMLYSRALAGAKRKSSEQHSGRTYAVRLTSFAQKTFIVRASDFRGADGRGRPYLAVIRRVTSRGLMAGRLLRFGRFIPDKQRRGGAAGVR